MIDVIERFREAGRNGLKWVEAVDQVDATLGENSAPERFDNAADAFDDGQRVRARAAVDDAIVTLASGCDPFIPWRKAEVAALASHNWVNPQRSTIGAELTYSDAEFLIEVAAQAAPISPAEIVEIVGARCPLPPNAHRIAGTALRDFQSTSSWRDEPLPSLDPDPGDDKRLNPEEARAEAEAAIASCRKAAGLSPLATLRWVDFARGETYAPPAWLVKGVLPGRGLGLLYGESSAGKTFLAIHAALCVAWGVPFFGRRVKPGGVLYIAAEGGSSVLPRLDAAEAELEGAIVTAHLTGTRQASTARAPIRVVTEAPNLSRDGDPAPLIRTIQEAARQFEACGSRLALVVVDTWHAALGGADENSAADAGHALKPLKDAVESLGVCVVALHHPGKDVERGARGSNALLAAVDTSIELRVPGCEGPRPKPAGMIRCATVVKQRDGETGNQFHYRLPVKLIGVDDDGDPWTTCTVLPCDAPKVDDDGLGANDRKLLEAIRATVAEEGGERARLEVVRLRFSNSLGDKTVEAKRQAWGRALKSARAGGRIETDDSDLMIWIPTPAGEA